MGSINILEKDTGNILDKAEKASQEKRKKIFGNNIDNIQNFFKPGNFKTSRLQIMEEIEEKIAHIAKLTREGEKLGGINLTESYKSTTDKIAEAIDKILGILEKRDIKITEIQKKDLWEEKFGCGYWTKKEVKDFPFDWVIGAILNHYKEISKSGKSCIDEEKFLSTEELQECLILTEKKLKKITI